MARNPKPYRRVVKVCQRYMRRIPEIEFWVNHKTGKVKVTKYDGPLEQLPGPLACRRLPIVPKHLRGWP